MQYVLSEEEYKALKADADCDTCQPQNLCPYNGKSWNQ